MIKSFADKDTARVFAREYVRRLPSTLHPVAWRKLAQLHAATRLDTLRLPPGNRLEALKRERAGQNRSRWWYDPLKRMSAASRRLPVWLSYALA